MARYISVLGFPPLQVANVGTFDTPGQNLNARNGVAVKAVYDKKVNEACATRLRRLAHWYCDPE